MFNWDELHAETVRSIAASLGIPPDLFDGDPNYSSHATWANAWGTRPDPAFIIVDDLASDRVDLASGPGVIIDAEFLPQRRPIAGLLACESVPGENLPPRTEPPAGERIMAGHAAYNVARHNELMVYLHDAGDHSKVPTVTNDAEWVVEQVAKDWGKRRIFYRDTEGGIDELEHVDGKFKGFKPGDVAELRELGIVSPPGAGGAG